MSLYDRSLLDSDKYPLPLGNTCDGTVRDLCPWAGSTSGTDQAGGTAAGGCVPVAAVPGGGGKNNGRYACK